MSDKKTISRRQLFRHTVALGGLAGLVAGPEALAQACRLTPRQGEGPYYPEGDLNRDNDLIQYDPSKPLAKGQVIYLSGLVKNPDCQPVAGALVEIWQAAASGKYNHSQDPNNLPLDPNFQYWGRTRTDARGAYRFRTIIPGHYPTGPNTYRPPHIHVKVHAQGHYSLTTQVYFDPRSYDDANLARIVDTLNKAENVSSDLIVLYRPLAADPKVRAGRFDFTIRPHR